MSWIARNKSRLFVAFLFLLSFLIYQANTKDERDQNWLDKSLLFITAPVQHAMVWAVDGVVSAWNDYVWLVDVAEENKKLKKHIGELQAKLVDYDETVSENERLRSLVNMSARLRGYSTVGARVIALSTSPSSQVIRVDVGSSDGVSLGDVVLSGSGLAGRVTAVGYNYSEAQLIIDSRSSVDVADYRSRARGMIKGQGVEDICLVDHLVRTADVKLGDRMLTSGIGGTYPPGLLVGTVVSVTSPKVGVFRKAFIEPSTDFSTLEEVLVLRRKGSFEPGEEQGGVNHVQEQR